MKIKNVFLLEYNKLFAKIKIILENKKPLKSNTTFDFYIGLKNCLKMISSR